MTHIRTIKIGNARDVWTCEQEALKEELHITTRSGVRIDVLQPKVEQIAEGWDDLMWMLSGMDRYAGATPMPYSVAEHSLIMEELIGKSIKSNMVRLWALLHDMHEAIGLGDVCSPTRKAIVRIAKEGYCSEYQTNAGITYGSPYWGTPNEFVFDPFKEWKGRFDWAIAEFAGLGGDFLDVKCCGAAVRRQIKTYDQIVGACELMWRRDHIDKMKEYGQQIEAEPVRITGENDLDVTIRGLSQEEAFKQFKNRFNELTAEI